MRHKESLVSPQQSYSSSSKSLGSSINSFCPEMLSPEETVELLNQLLKKVCKSSKMMKSLTSDPVIR